MGRAKGMAGDNQMKPTYRDRMPSLIGLALLFVLLITEGASLFVLAIVAAGAGMVLSACLLADHQSNSGR